MASRSLKKSRMNRISRTSSGLCRRRSSLEQVKVEQAAMPHIIGEFQTFGLAQAALCLRGYAKKTGVTCKRAAAPTGHHQTKSWDAEQADEVMGTPQPTSVVDTAGRCKVANSKYRCRHFEKKIERHETDGKRTRTPLNETARKRTLVPLRIMEWKRKTRFGENCETSPSREKCSWATWLLWLCFVVIVL